MQIAVMKALELEESSINESSFITAVQLQHNNDCEHVLYFRPRYAVRT